MENSDTSRPVATLSDSEFTLTVKDAVALYAEAGITLDERTVQRYCAKNRLSYVRLKPEDGGKYLITRSSVEKNIAHIKEVRPPTSRDVSRTVATTVLAENKDQIEQPQATKGDDILRQAPTNFDLSRPVATAAAPENKDDKPRQELPTANDQSRQVATGLDFSRYVARLEGDIDFLRGQLEVKDIQIKEMAERAHETNVIIAGQQKMLAPLLGNPKDRREDMEERFDQPN